MVRDVDKSTVIKSTLGEFTHCLPDTSSSNWLGLQDDDFKGDRGQYILTRWNDDHPKLTLDSYDRVTKVCSRSKVASEWLMNANNTYSLNIQVPLYYKDRINAFKFSEIGEILKKIGDVQKDYSNKLKEASDNYKKELNKIDSIFKTKLQVDGYNDKYLRVINLSAEYLPLSLILAIESYDSTTSSVPTRKAYARETLIQYKISLLNQLNQDPEIDIEEIISKNSVK